MSPVAAVAGLNPFEFRASFGRDVAAGVRGALDGLNPFEFRASFGLTVLSRSIPA